jgi:hypothetical protein
LTLPDDGWFARCRALVTRFLFACQGGGYPDELDSPAITIKLGDVISLEGDDGTVAGLREPGVERRVKHDIVAVNDVPNHDDGGERVFASRHPAHSASSKPVHTLTLSKRVHVARHD